MQEHFSFGDARRHCEACADSCTAVATISLPFRRQRAELIQLPLPLINGTATPCRESASTADNGSLCRRDPNVVASVQAVNRKLI
jgi:hypothetical protein